MSAKITRDLIRPKSEWITRVFSRSSCCIGSGRSVGRSIVSRVFLYQSGNPCLSFNILRCIPWTFDSISLRRHDPFIHLSMDQGGMLLLTTEEIWRQGAAAVSSSATIVSISMTAMHQLEHRKSTNLQDMEKEKVIPQSLSWNWSWPLLCDNRCNIRVL